MKTYTITQPYISPRCKLAEAPHYNPTTSTLRFVDIAQKTLHTINLSLGPQSHKALQLDFSIGCTADLEGSDTEFVFGGKFGAGIFDLATGRSRWVRRWGEIGHESQSESWIGMDGVEIDMSGLRSNDGTVDARGRFLVGTMTDGEDPTCEGHIFSLPSLSTEATSSVPTLRRIFTPLTIPNGISFAPRSDKIYITDSTTHRITTYPYNISTGEIDSSTPGVFLDTSKNGLDLGGVPDGHARDVEGNFWVAIYGGGCVICVDEQGKLRTKVEVPTPNVTCCCFAGRTLYITTAADDKEVVHEGEVRFGGAVYCVDVGIEGATLNEFRWDDESVST